MFADKFERAEKEIQRGIIFGADNEKLTKMILHYTNLYNELINAQKKQVIQIIWRKLNKNTGSSKINQHINWLRIKKFFWWVKLIKNQIQNWVFWKNGAMYIWCFRYLKYYNSNDIKKNYFWRKLKSWKFENIIKIYDRLYWVFDFLDIFEK